MREIKFRGKRVDCNVWVVGYFEITWSVQLGKSTRRHWINVNTEFSYDEKYEVHVESVGEYTGLKDKNGKDIYESDIVRYSHESICVVEWGSVSKGVDLGFVLREITDKNRICNLLGIEESEIIGDIYTTPELLTNKNK